MTFWQSILAIVVAPATVLWVVGWLIRHFLDRSFDRDLERYRSELDLVRIEYETRLSAVQERRAEVIAEVYARLVDAHLGLGGFVTPVQFDTRPYNERRRDAVVACVAFTDYFPRIRIFLDKDICERLDELAKLTRKVFSLSDLTHIESGAGPEEVGYSQKAWDEFEDQFPPAVEALEERFRELVGVEKPRKA